MRFSGPGFSGAVSRADRDGPARQGARKEGGEGDEGEYCGAVIACISFEAADSGGCRSGRVYTR